MNHQGSMGFSGTNTFLDREIYFRIRINDIMVFICLFVLFIALTLGGIWAYNRYQKKNDYIEIH